ncbi:MAG: phosphatase PAP2 family protein [Eubacterium sp.]|nr:phosphatase PAP2 family protein [Eubacterium sp.]
MYGPITQWDADILLYIQDHLRADWLTPIMKVITHLGEKGIFWILLCIALLIPKRTRRVGLISALALLFGWLTCNVVIKSLVGRVRPYEVIEGLTSLVGAQKDTSFPSGHAAAAFATTIGFCLASWSKKEHWPKWPGIALIVLSLLICFSRLYVGVHYPTDVIAGILISSAIATGVYFIFLAVEKKIMKRKQERDDANAMSPL